jgi:hypothetical protein
VVGLSESDVREGGVIAIWLKVGLSEWPVEMGENVGL